MFNALFRSNMTNNYSKTTTHFTETMHTVAQKILASCDSGECFNHVDSTPMPSQESIAQVVHKIRRIIFPGYFNQRALSPSNLEFWMQQEMTDLYRKISKLILFSAQHDCLLYNEPCTDCSKLSRKTALEFIQLFPRLRSILAKDVRAALEGDPAAKSYDEIIFSYPGLFAITVQRIAHELNKCKVQLVPRMMTEYAHSITGIDIHPGATIGEYFFIDHGTGVVVGETTEIGKRVRLYQGVTLGALSIPSETVDNLRDKKRHPTIEDDVIIYSNTTILGGNTVIGARSTIGGNVWITESIPPDTKVLLKKPELFFFKDNKKNLTADGKNERNTNFLPTGTRGVD